MISHPHPPNSFIEFSKEEIEQSIPARFEQQVNKYPIRLAVKTKSQSLTYETLNRLANRIGRAILAQRGESEEPVGLLLEPGPMAVAAIFGVLKAGKIWVPLDPTLPQARLTYILEDTQAPLIIAADQTLSLAKALSRSIQIINLDQFDPSFSGENIDLSITPDNLAYILYTSGSTGQPKGVMQTQRNVLHSIRGHTNSLHICANDRLALLASYSHLSGVTSTFRALFNGAALLPFHLKKEGITHLAGWLQQEEITIYQSVPTVFRHLVETLTGEETFLQLRLIHLGGEPVSKRDVELYKKYFAPDCLLLCNLGSTEVSTYRHYFINKKTEINSHIIPVGYEVEDKEVLLLNEAGQPVGFNEVGEIVVKSRYLTPGYWGRHDLTEAVFIPVPGQAEERLFHTGDLGRMLPDGCLFHVGRKDAQVKIRGQRVEIAEIETVLLEHPQVKEVAIIVQDHELRGKQLVAYVVAQKAAQKNGGIEEGRDERVKRQKRDEARVLTRNSKLETLDLVSEFRSFLRQKLPEYMIPATFVMMEALPLLPAGKINRRALLSLDLSPPQPGDTFVAPRDSLEQQLTEIWQELLGIQPIGVRDNFFDRGGHSLLAMRLLTQIKKRLGQDLPPTVLFQAPTIEQMAALLRQEEKISPWSSLVALRPHGANLPFFCLPGNLGNVFTDLSYLAQYLDPDQPLYGLQDGLHNPARIEALAAHYLNEIRSVQPKGPYLLGGLCAGGVVAFEMAQQLQAQGQPVALLALIEPAPPRGLGLRAYLDFTGLVARRLIRRFGHHSSHLTRLAPTEQRTYARLKAKLMANSWALRRYAPRPYRGRFHLFLTRTSLQLPGNPQLSWRSLATQGIELHELPGNHDTITGNNDTKIEAAHMQVLAEQLRSCINAALTKTYQPGQVKDQIEETIKYKKKSSEGL